MVYLLVFISVAAMTGAQLVLKKGLILVGQAPQGFGELVQFYFRYLTSIYGISAILLTAITALAWIQAVSRAEISYLYPFMALSYVLVALFSMWLFHENITVLRWAGIVVVCAGVFLISQS